MHMFTMGKGFLQALAGSISGDRDILEAILYGGIQVAAADGRISKDEITQVESNAVSDPLVARIYTPDVIHLGMNTAVQKLKEAGSGAMQLAEKQVRDIAKREETIRHGVYLSIYRVAAHGSVDAKERSVLDRIASQLNITEEDKVSIEGSAAPSGGITFDF